MEQSTSTILIDKQIHTLYRIFCKWCDVFKTKPKNVIINQGNFITTQWKSIEINENIKLLNTTALILKLFLLFPK